MSDEKELMDRFYASMAVGMDSLKDENNPLNIMLDGLNNHYKSLGYTDSHARFLTCIALGWKVPDVED